MTSQVHPNKFKIDGMYFEVAEWVANTDRRFQNLLFENGEFYLIDHSHALSGHSWTVDQLIPKEQFANLLLGFANKILTQHERFQWRRDISDLSADFAETPFSSMHIAAHMDLYSTPIQAVAVLKFLKKRVKFMPPLAANRLGLKELDLL